MMTLVERDGNWRFRGAKLPGLEMKMKTDEVDGNHNLKESGMISNSSVTITIQL